MLPLMSRLFTSADTNPVSWAELGCWVEKLAAEIIAITGPVHAVAPLLRSGGVLGSMLAIRFGTIPILPLQFKYAYSPTRLERLLEPPMLRFSLPDAPTILLTEGNTSSGRTAQAGANLLRESLPNARFYLATLTKVYGGPDKIDGIEHIFYGSLTDEAFRTTPEQRQKLNLRAGITIFPWENIDDELRDINSI
jgi:hypoxanthine phosphoribosyltransferase